jgi:hypothetical protein
MVSRAGAECGRVPPVIGSFFPTTADYQTRHIYNQFVILSSAATS